MPEHDGRGFDSGAEFDRLLRSSLETYADHGPDSDLAERVLARIAAEGERERMRRTERRHLVIRWAIALPVAACLVVVMVLAGLRALHNAPDGANQARVVPPKSNNAGRVGPIVNSPSIAARHNDASRSLRHSARAVATARVQRLPKLDVFPTPQPLTPEEQAFAAYVARVPEAERKSLIDTEKQVDAPLSIAALEIQPIAPPDTGGN
jgi:hypothetical protein